MKLATYRDGSRDGQLIVVSRDLSQAQFVNAIASRLQQVLDDWNFLAPQLEAVSQSLNQGKARHAFAFDPAQCMAPLPRAHEVLYAAGSELTRLGGHSLWGAQQSISLGARVLDVGAPGLGFDACVAVVCGDVAAQASAANALDGVRLLGLCSVWQLPQLASPHRLPGCSVAPVLATPDELGEAWRGGRLQLPMQLMLNGRKPGNGADESRPEGERKPTHFGEWLQEAARLQPLRAGTVLLCGAQDAPAAHRLHGGDSLRLDIKVQDGSSAFGAIDVELLVSSQANAGPLPKFACPLGGA